jgi:hypothetical protein
MVSCNFNLLFIFQKLAIHLIRVIRIFQMAYSLKIDYVVNVTRSIEISEVTESPFKRIFESGLTTFTLGGRATLFLVFTF